MRQYQKQLDELEVATRRAKDAKRGVRYIQENRPDGACWWLVIDTPSATIRLPHNYRDKLHREDE